MSHKINDIEKKGSQKSVALHSWDGLFDPTQESQRMLSTLISNLPGVVYRCLNNREYTMFFVSKRIKDIFGINAEDLINNKRYSFADFLHPDDVEWIWIETQSKVKNKKPFRLDYRIIDLYGNIKWIWEQGVGVYSDTGELLGLEGFLIDITDKIILEKKLEKSKNLALLGEFSSAIAHQFRNPLGDCLLNAKLMQELLQPMDEEEIENCGKDLSFVFLSDLRKKLKMHLLNLIKKINDLNSIVTQILNYTKNMKLMFSNQKIEILLQDIISAFRKTLQKFGIEIVLSIEKELDEIKVDAILITQAFQNLIDNSVKILPEGGYIKIHVNSFEGSIKCVIMTITDSGPGVNEECKEKLFRPFYTTRASGTGLGLSFAKRVIEAHNGKIWLCNPDSCGKFYMNLCEKSKELNGQKLSGATFHIMLPLQ